MMVPDYYTTKKGGDWFKFPAVRQKLFKLGDLTKRDLSYVIIAGITVHSLRFKSQSPGYDIPLIWDCIGGIRNPAYVKCIL